MPHFMMNLKYSQSAIKAMVANPSDRRKVAEDALAAVGGSLKAFYFVFGESDLVIIYEAPNGVSAAAIAMTLGASGAASGVETHLLMTSEEATEAMRQAGSTQTAYRPPS